MLQPIGFRQNTILTSLGQMVYYSNDDAPWTTDATLETTKETLVFLHGFGGGSSAYEWSKVYPAFASKYRILAPDLIGWGKSEHLARPYRIQDYLTTLTEFIEKTCRDRITVIASSLTAALLVRIGVDRSELFGSFILMAPSGLSDFGKDYTQTFLAQLISTPGLDQLFYRAGLATNFGIQAFLEQRQFARPERIYRELVEAYLESAQQPNADYSALSFVRGDLCFDLAEYIPQLTVPTAILWGQKSQFTAPEIGRRLTQLNPQAIRVFQEIEDTGLTPQLELPAVTVGLIQQCLGTLR
jgi:pimeloyl-ACP methyl ester carboxylesterase